MPWRRIAVALVTPVGLAAVNLLCWASAGPGWRATLALTVAAACLAVAFVLPAAALVLYRIVHATVKVRLHPFVACRLSSRITLGTGRAAGIILWFALAITAGNLPAPRFSTGPLGWAAVIAVIVLARLRVSRRAAEEEEPLRVSGRSQPFDPGSPLGPLVEPAARGLGLARPCHLVLGLFPIISCRARDVKVGDQLLSGGALCLSLPMCRLLDRSELAGLIAFDMAQQPLDSAVWRSIEASFGWCAAVAGMTPSRRFLQILSAPLFLLPGLWAHAWAGVGTIVLRYAAQRGAIAAGRETMAAALAKPFFYPAAGEAVFTALHAEVRRAQPTVAGEDVSRRLAERWASLPNEPETAAAFTSPEALAAAQPLYAWLVAALGVEPTAILDRLRAAPIDPAIELIEGAADVERQLGAEVIAQMLPEWPPRRDGGAPASTVGPSAADYDWRARAEANLAKPDPRPLLVGARDRPTVEGAIVLLFAVLLGAFAIWDLGGPAFGRVARWLGF